MSKRPITFTMKNKGHFFASILILTMILSSFPSQALDGASTNNGAPGFVFPNLNTPQVAKQAKKKESSKASEVKTSQVPVKKKVVKKVRKVAKSVKAYNKE